MPGERYRGVVKDAVIVLEEEARLPEGMPVWVIPQVEPGGEPNWETDPFLRVDDLLPPVPDRLPKDLAERFEEYLYGDAWRRWREESS